MHDHRGGRTHHDPTTGGPAVHPPPPTFWREPQVQALAWPAARSGNRRRRTRRLWAMDRTPVTPLEERPTAARTHGKRPW
jgi:hypothetical protein